jgi:hypothetical protein
MPLGAASSNYFIGVELLKGDVGLPAYTLLPNSEYYEDYLGSESASDKASLKFSRAEGGAPDSTKGVLLFQTDSPLSSQRPPGQRFVKKKRELSLGPRPDVFEFSCVATQYPPPACRILTTFPFGLDNVVAGLPLTLGPSSIDRSKNWSSATHTTVITLNRL